ncbi:MAG: molybdenum cofactor biosynthesis protein B [Candidatus Puniceispirillum sp. TMED52]|nr:molybdenum cofactor biosynthesis protein B [SAR116 cluster bacterium]OUU50436.1 MAG: molybdenum cofactor biosynthesis protein B [Candidatus Puniceispirillum sp. TMED52]HCP18477.1 molybdenum cofactor biosynthesis protein B [Alphaproteobacteria bacterium]
MAIDPAIPFQPIAIAVLTVSDTRTPDTDKSGDVLAERITQAGHHLIDRAIVSDDIDHIADQIKRWSSGDQVDAIITTGGTGLTGRDVTPEALTSIMDKPIEGFGEAFRWMSYQKIGTSAMQSRAMAGVVNGVYVFALPGSPSACRDGWDELLSLQLDIRHKPCNFVEIMPRLMEQGIGGRNG